MKRILTLLIAACSAFSLLFPAIGSADPVYEFPFPNDPSGFGNYRDFSKFVPYALNIWQYNFDLGNALQIVGTGPHFEYTPTSSNMPGWVNPWKEWDNSTNTWKVDWAEGQHKYMINLGSPTGGQPAAIPGLHPANYATSGLLVLTTTSLTLPQIPLVLNDATNQPWIDAWAAFASKSEVLGIVVFMPSISTGFVYEKPPQVPEPGILLLLGAGLVAVGIRRIRR